MGETFILYGENGGKNVCWMNVSSSKSLTYIWNGQFHAEIWKLYKIHRILDFIIISKPCGVVQIGNTINYHYLPFRIQTRKCGRSYYHAYGPEVVELDAE